MFSIPSVAALSSTLNLMSTVMWYKSWLYNLLDILSCEIQDGFGLGKGYMRNIAGRIDGRFFRSGNFIIIVEKCLIFQQNVRYLDWVYFRWAGMERKTPPPGYICHRCNVSGMSYLWNLLLFTQCYCCSIGRCPRYLWQAPPRLYYPYLLRFWDSRNKHKLPLQWFSQDHLTINPT